MCCFPKSPRKRARHVNETNHSDSCSEVRSDLLAVWGSSGPIFPDTGHIFRYSPCLPACVAISSTALSSASRVHTGTEHANWAGLSLH
ncbi:hypothetical protein BsWGS_22647 [Bradybaena similaris]